MARVDIAAGIDAELAADPDLGAALEDIADEVAVLARQIVHVRSGLTKASIDVGGGAGGAVVSAAGHSIYLERGSIPNRGHKSSRPGHPFLSTALWELGGG